MGGEERCTRGIAGASLLAKVNVHSHCWVVQSLLSVSGGWCQGVGFVEQTRRRWTLLEACVCFGLLWLWAFDRLASQLFWFLVNIPCDGHFLATQHLLLLFFWGGSRLIVRDLLLYYVRLSPCLTFIWLKGGHLSQDLCVFGLLLPRGLQRGENNAFSFWLLLVVVPWGHIY